MTAKRAKRTSVWHAIRTGISFAFLILIAVLLIAAVIVPRVTNSLALTILSPSMEPAMPVGSLIVTKPTDTKDIKIGDAITYQITSGEPTLLTHRVIEVSQNSDGTRSFRTQGDNNNVPDSQSVIDKQVKGVVWYTIPLLGYVNHWITNEARSWLIPGIAGALIVYAIFIALKGKSRPKKGRRKITSETLSDDAPEILPFSVREDAQSQDEAGNSPEAHLSPPSQTHSKARESSSP